MQLSIHDWLEVSQYQVHHRDTLVSQPFPETAQKHKVTPQAVLTVSPPVTPSKTVKLCVATEGRCCWVTEIFSLQQIWLETCGWTNMGTINDGADLKFSFILNYKILSNSIVT